MMSTATSTLATRLRLPRDPRWYQITALTSLLAYGIVFLGFGVDPGRVALLVAMALAVQWLAGRSVGVERFDAKSPLISALSLSLLLRTSSPLLAMLAAALAIGSKFAIRRRGKHVFNPTNFALVVLIAVTDGAWVSPGQWGSAAILVFAMAAAGMIVLYRAARFDVTWAFLGSWAAILVGRAMWLGDPLTIPWHQMQSGGLMIFAFFMISDPKTTPDSRVGRIVFAALVAALGAWWQLWRFEPTGLLFALAASAPLVPLLDRLFPGTRYSWARPTAVPAQPPQPTLSPVRSSAFDVPALERSSP